jgi:hypothetical protein
MAMKSLAFHDQLVADFAAYEDHDDFAFLDIIQGRIIAAGPRLR